MKTRQLLTGGLSDEPFHEVQKDPLHLAAWQFLCDWQEQQQAF
jgi:hypothetical protein